MVGARSTALATSRTPGRSCRICRTCARRSCALRCSKAESAHFRIATSRTPPRKCERPCGHCALGSPSPTATRSSRTRRPRRLHRSTRASRPGSGNTHWRARPRMCRSMVRVDSSRFSSLSTSASSPGETRRTRNAVSRSHLPEPSGPQPQARLPRPLARMPECSLPDVSLPPLCGRLRRGGGESGGCGAGLWRKEHFAMTSRKVLLQCPKSDGIIRSVGEDRATWCYTAFEPRMRPRSLNGSPRRVSEVRFGRGCHTEVRLESGT
mmetsp:Transcript_40001/g.113392  ORF Transcript_40001/g.113392 Transcript_40001/m.113392 type:complete len:266 (-) Transcript_40001:38-835(-)